MNLMKTARDWKEQFVRFIHSRKIAYCTVFGPDTPAHKAVLEDLARFCRANTSTFHSDPRLHAVLEGRREVWLRIQNHLNLTPAQLCSLLEKEGTNG